MTIDKFLEITSYIGSIVKGSEFENHVFAVGGSVRDYVMGGEIKDIDLVIDLPKGGINFANFCKEHGFVKGSVVIYETYGTAMFHFKEYPTEEIECVMTRGEKYTDEGSRNPVTTFANIEEDAKRRDLTINALYYNVSSSEIVDFGSGVYDIKERILRVPMENNADQTFIDDPLRILRVIRFHSKLLGFKISKETLEAMKRNSDRLSIITKERVNVELVKILMSDNPVSGIKLIHEIGAMKYVIPELEKCVGLKQNEYHVGDVWEHTLVALRNDCKLFETPDIVVRLAVLLHDIGKINCQTIDEKGNIHFIGHEKESGVIAREALKRLKFDNKTIDEVVFVIENHMRTKNYGYCCEKMKISQFNKFAYECGNFKRFERVCRVIEDDNYAHAKDHIIIGQYDALIDKTIGSVMFGYKLPINGNDIMNEFSIKPGPDVKNVLDQVLHCAFNDPNITREVALSYAKGALNNVKNAKKL